MKRCYALVVAVAVCASAASVFGSGASAAPSCAATTPDVQPFVPWGDSSWYNLGPSGSFEDSLSGWTLTGSAAVVPGNESFYVNSPTDQNSLSLPTGSTAKTPYVCITTDYPNMRFFVQNSGTKSAQLRIDQLQLQQNGIVKIVKTTNIAATAAWAPSSMISIQPPPPSQGNGTVAFKFTPQGSTGKWRIDDWYVDPIKHSHHG